MPEQPSLDIIVAQEGEWGPRDEVWLEELEVLPAEQDEVLVSHVVAVWWHHVGVLRLRQPVVLPMLQWVGEAAGGVSCVAGLILALSLKLPRG